MVKIWVLDSETCLKQQLKGRPKNMFSKPIIAYCRPKELLNAPMEHSTILSTFTKLLPGFKIFVLFIFEWLL